MKFKHYASVGLVAFGVLHLLQREHHHRADQDLKTLRHQADQELTAIHHDEHLEKLTTLADAHAAQAELHHLQNLDATVTGLHDRWLDALTQNADLADKWRPADLPDDVDYRESLDVNRQLCALALRYRVGLISDDRLRFVADALMVRPAVREYWRMHGTWRTAETKDDESHQRFHEILADAASTAEAHTTAGAGV